MLEVKAPTTIEDKATILSIYPEALRESKPGLHPGIYQLPACPDVRRPILIPIKPASHFIYIGDKRTYEVVNKAYDLARSIVYDIITSSLTATENAHPGFLALPGEVQYTELFTTYKDQVKAIQDIQANWFRSLVELADDYWNKYHTYNSISEIQRKAAQFLNLKDREWMSVTNSEVSNNCPVCQSLISPNAVVCKVCKAILDDKRYKEFSFAKTA